MRPRQLAGDTPYEKLAVNFLAMLKVAMVQHYVKTHLRDTTWSIEGVWKLRPGIVAGVVRQADACREDHNRP